MFMQEKNKEVEVKYLLKNANDSVESLDLWATSLFKNQYQHDYYYVPSHRDFLSASPVSEWLRVRETEKKNTINYKHWDNNAGQTITCDEYEVLIDNSFNMKDILKKLDFSEIVTVEKYRSSWSYKNIEISIDNVVGLGYYIEFELMQKLDSEIEYINFVKSIAGDFGFELGDQNFDGYPMLLINQQKDNR